MEDLYNKFIVTSVVSGNKVCQRGGVKYKNSKKYVDKLKDKGKAGNGLASQMMNPFFVFYFL